MTKLLPEILAMSWQGQSEYLSGLSRKELELLWFELQRIRDGIENLHVAVFSVLRDAYEAEGGNRR